MRSVGISVSLNVLIADIIGQQYSALLHFVYTHSLRFCVFSNICMLILRVSTKVHTQTLPMLEEW
jgi:hypothetical protein